jgi:hypothetical protein
MIAMGEEQDRLDRLQEKIDAERAELRKDSGESERHFIDDGAADDDAVDDTIAPA